MPRATGARMANIPAFVIEKVNGVTVTDDGQHALFQVNDGQNTHALAIPVPQLANLMTLSSQAAGEAARKTRADPALKQVFPCEWWQFGLAPDNQTMVLSFRMPGGMEVSFSVHKDRAGQMIEALAAIAGQHAPPPPGTTRQ